MRAAPIAVAALAGFVAGAVVFLVTDAVSDSRIAFGSLALYGNGALVVPVLLVPLVLYAGWTTLARRGVREALVVFPIALTAGALVEGPGGAFFIGAIAAVDSVLTAVAALLPRRVALVVLVFALAPLLLLPLTHGLDGARR